jgi:hypothetical protein
MKPFWEIFLFFTSLKNLCVFHLSRSPITTRPLWKTSVFFTILKKSLKNLCIFHPGRSPITIRPSQKKKFNFLWVGHPWQFDHFKISEFAKEKSSSFYSECAFLPSKGFIISQYDESFISHSFFSSLQRLLSKVSYETFYRKYCKEWGNHFGILNELWGIVFQCIWWIQEHKTSSGQPHLGPNTFLLPVLDRTSLPLQWL